jgi:hypothetical protein
MAEEKDLQSMNDLRSILNDIIQSVSPEVRSKLEAKFLGGPALRLSSAIESQVRSAINESLPWAIDEALRNHGYSEEIAGLLHLLAARSNDPKEDVLKKALTLYGLALDAIEKGNKLAILTPDDAIVHDVIGIGPEQSVVGRVAG